MRKIDVGSTHHFRPTLLRRLHNKKENTRPTQEGDETRGDDARLTNVPHARGVLLGWFRLCLGHRFVQVESRHRKVDADCIESRERCGEEVEGRGRGNREDEIGGGDDDVKVRVFLTTTITTTTTTRESERRRRGM